MAANLVLNLSHSQPAKPREVREHASYPKQPPNTGAEGPSSKHGSLVRREVSGGSRKRMTGAGEKEQNKVDQKDSFTRDIDPSSYRNSIFHNICTEMLEKGFHESFTELFELVQHQRSDHEKAGAASILLEPLIEHNHAKLEYLRVQLTVAEDARQANDLDTVYMAQRNLAQYFEHTEDAKRTKDKWLADYFYNRCLETGSLVEGDNRRKEGEAHCHVGLSLENRGDLTKAAHHMEIFHDLAGKHKWYTESGDSFHEIACEHLRRMYTAIAEEVHSEDPNSSIDYLKKAYRIAQEGGDAYQEGKASYRLGNALEELGESDSAITYHKQYLERCKYHNNKAGVCKAYEALARSFESKGDMKSAANFLEMFVSVAEGAGLQDSLADACSAVGTMYNTMGDYDKAVEYFGRCYDICSQLDNAAALYSARVQYGIAKGHQFMENFSDFVSDSTSPEGLQQLVVWKDARVVMAEPEEGEEIEREDVQPEEEKREREEKDKKEAEYEGTEETTYSACSEENEVTEGTEESTSITY